MESVFERILWQHCTTRRTIQRILRSHRRKGKRHRALLRGRKVQEVPDLNATQRAHAGCSETKQTVLVAYTYTHYPQHALFSKPFLGPYSIEPWIYCLHPAMKVATKGKQSRLRRYLQDINALSFTTSMLLRSTSDKDESTDES